MPYLLHPRRLIQQAEQPLVVSAVIFWWGGVVAPHLISLVFPELLPPDAIPDHLNPNSEGTVANAISTGTRADAEQAAGDRANANLRLGLARSGGQFGNCPGVYSVRPSHPLIAKLATKA